MTADGSEDDKITPEGLLSYKVPPPVDCMLASEALPTVNQAVGGGVDFNIAEESNKGYTDGDVQPDDEGDELEDHVDDRLMDAPYCGRQMKVLYENGWHTGEITYYNDNLQKYYIKFDDGSEDYIGEENIDMIEVCVV